MMNMAGVVDMRLHVQFVLLVLSLVSCFVLVVDGTGAESIEFAGCLLSPTDYQNLKRLRLDGYLSFYTSPYAAEDYGLLRSLKPAAVLYPGSVRDIAKVINAVRYSNITVAGRGAGHSTFGQAMALDGIVVNLTVLRGISVNDEAMYVDAAGGELWVDILRATLPAGLTPKGFTDYVRLTVGGTLSNAGVGGQSFIYGPQISNILELEVVTGTGRIIICSREMQSDLFYGVLGGLGQFGIITRARIALTRTPTSVRWIRALYSDFDNFKRDQLSLTSQMSIATGTASYVEGFVISNSPNLQTGWNSVPLTPNQAVNASMLPDASTTPVLYYIELGMSYDESDTVPSVDQKQQELLASLGYIPGQLFVRELSYFDFVDRLGPVEQLLRSEGQWVVPHPWINLFVPESKMREFDATVFQSLTYIAGPILAYPYVRDKWDSSMSVKIPDEDIVYLVAFLDSVVPSVGPSVETLLARNSVILKYCESLGCKQYLPKLERQSDWITHFGSSWNTFLKRKIMYDPRGILAPGQNIFQRNQVPALS